MPKIVSKEDLARAVIVSEGPPRERKAPARSTLEDVLGQVAHAVQLLVDLHVATQRLIDRKQPADDHDAVQALERLASIQVQVQALLGVLVENRIAPAPVQNITVVHPRDDRAISYLLTRDGYGNLTKIRRVFE